MGRDEPALSAESPRAVRKGSKGNSWPIFHGNISPGKLGIDGFDHGVQTIYHSLQTDLNWFKVRRSAESPTRLDTLMDFWVNYVTVQQDVHVLFQSTNYARMLRPEDLQVREGFNYKTFQIYNICSEQKEGTK